MVKSCLLVLVIVFGLIVVRLAASGDMSYTKSVKNPQEVKIEQLKAQASDLAGKLNQKDNETKLHIEKVKNDMSLEIKRVKVEDKTIQSKINAMNKHLRGKLTRKGDMFYYAGSLYNVNPLLLAAISMQETGNGNSNAIKTKNNVGGIMKDSNLGILREFEDIDISIVEMARILKTGYIDKKLKDIPAIGSKYCPVGAKNDPNGLNKHWVPNITANYKLLEDSIEKE